MEKFSGLIKEELNHFNVPNKMLDLLEKYGIGIYEITNEDGYFKKNNSLMLKDEEGIEEFRIYIGKKYIKEDFEENWGDDLEQALEKYGDEEEVIRRDFDKIGKIEKNEDIYELQFSVFLNGIKFLTPKDKKYDIFVKACLTKAFLYFYILKETVTETYKEAILDNYGRDILRYEKDTLSLGKFSQLHDIKISNRNLHVVNDVLYRLYKDSKFFYALEELIGKDNYKEFIDELSKIKI